MQQVRGIRGWPFWGLPRVLRAYICAVVVAAAGMISWLAWTETPAFRDFGVLGMLIACGVLVTSASRGFLRGVAGDFRQDLNSVWKFPVALLLPPFFAAIAPLFFVILWQRSVHKQTFRHRQIFTIATMSLGDSVVSMLFHALAPAGSSRLVWFGAALVAAVAGRACNFFFIAMVLKLTNPAGLKQLADPEGLMYAGVEVSTGIVVAALAQQQLLLIILAVPATILLHRGLLHEQLRAMSRTDTKTAVLNAGAWEQDAAMELARAKRVEEPTSVLICDIDHFKRVNDQHGHLNGDMALKAVAQRLQALLRQGDILGRFGGEEFVILLSGIGLVNAKSIAERLRRNVANDPIQLDSAAIHLTVSLGVSTSETSHDSLAEMLAAADEALYVAKRRGRDRVIIARKLQSAESLQLDEFAGSGGDSADSAETADAAETADLADAASPDESAESVDADAPARRASG